ncbi:hypothetical protein [Companilactobacillus keshanensis]|uniref:Bacteriocin immunity protein n=1 Tax=Companilactobacillus keshanensis TaxID=2486003 RepID=A0ABW4BXJ3_9LACO|nr:hypothetical protein [Companilactobacillus keshanensis]
MKKIEKINSINKLLNELNFSLDNEFAKKAVLTAYIKINKSEKISSKVKEVPEAIDNMEYDFIYLSRQDYKFSDKSMEIYQQLKALSRTKFGHGWGGLIFAPIW